MSAKKNKNVEEQFNDYEATPVPEEVHMSWLSQELYGLAVDSVWQRFQQAES